jgi:DnaD/phage-associated family protein
MIAEILKDAERTYPQPWIEESIQIAVERNIRSWRYVESILKRWLAEGKSDGRSVQANAGKDRGAAGAYGDYERFWDSE